MIDIGIGKIGVAESLLDQPAESGIDALLVAEPMLREVRLDSEISGVTKFAVSVAALSAKCDYPIFCGCGTRLGSMRHVSVMTFARGKLLDIADRTFNFTYGGYEEGDTIKIMRLKRFDLALLVDTDILLAKNWKRVASQCDAVAGVGVASGDADYAYIPTLSSLFSKPYAMAFADGQVLWGTPTEGE